MRRRIRATCIGGLATFIAAAALAVPGASAKPREDSKITARFNDNFALVGKVKSVPACERGRKVLLIREDAMGGREVADRTRTNRSGRYSFGRILFEVNSDYFVKAETRNRSKVICKSDTAPVVSEE